MKAQFGGVMVLSPKSSYTIFVVYSMVFRSSPWSIIPYFCAPAFKEVIFLLQKSSSQHQRTIIITPSELCNFGILLIVNFD